jgi:hypothetical protein
MVAASAVLAGLSTGVTASFLATGVFVFNLGQFAMAVGGSLLMSGAQMLLSSGQKKNKATLNQAQGSTQNFRQAITPHALVYGQRRVGGPITFIGSSQENQYIHMVITLAAHELTEIGEVWFNDECIPADFLDGTGNVISGRYAGFARIRKLLGNPSQAADSYLVSEVAEWTNNHRQRGRAYLYVRLKYSQDVFSNGIPQITTLVKGKKVLDPRDGNIKFTLNPALIARDYLASTEYGFEAEGNISDASVIAAANNCDEMVTVQSEALTVTAVDTALDTLRIDSNNLTFALGDRVQVTTAGSLPGGISAATNYFVIPYQFGNQTGSFSLNKPRFRLATSLANAEAGIYINITSTGSGPHTVTKNAEPRYSAAAYMDTANTLGDNMIQLLSGFGGKAVYVGGQWKIHAPVYNTPTLTITDADIIAPLQVQTKISRAERFSQIKGIYTSHLNKWQEADYPPITDDAAALRDGQVITRDYDLPVTFRPQTAKRLAKIELKKAAQEITVTAVCNLKLLQAECVDVVNITNASLGWSAKPFEVVGFEFTMGGSSDTPELGVKLTLRETASAIYDWASSEESDIDDAPNTSLPNAFEVQAVTGLRFDSLPLDTRDGDATFNLVLYWDAHPDAFVLSGGRYEVQYKRAADADYQPSFFVDGELTSSPFAQASAGTTYEARIRAVNNIGARSSWQTLTGITSGGSGGVTSSEDWGSVAVAPTTTEDWGAVTAAPTTTEDWGNV